MIQTLKEAQDGTNQNQQQIKLNLSYLKEANGFAKELSDKNLPECVITLAVIHTVLIFLLIVLLISQSIRLKKGNNEISKKQIYKITSVIFILYSKILQIPLVDIMINNALATQQTSRESVNIVYLVLTIYSLFVYFGF